jgi:biopolymer transport protein TolR
MSMSQPSANKRSGKTSLAEINVTPMVDVMLVLLIVFMVSAPLMQQGIEVNLPKADAGSINQSEDPLILTIKANQAIEMESKTYTLANMTEHLSAIAIAKPNLQVLVQADQSVPYGIVAKAMAQVKKAKIHRVGLITAPETGN